MAQVVIALTFLSALSSGLIAGVFFAFSVSVMPGLGRLPPPQGIAAMQSINVAILNPWFFAAFFGTAAACVFLWIFSLLTWPEAPAIYLLVGSLAYLVGSILVTIVFNVPLNNALEAVDPESAAGARLWADYLSRWTSWNHARAAASAAAATSFIIALC
jgi:uncharacterized membrane protein